MPEISESNLLTVAETARRLHVSKPTVYRRIHEGQIPAVRVGNGTGPIRVDQRELEAWLYSVPSEAA